MQITGIQGIPLSSRYGQNTVLGQQSPFKSLALVRVETDEGIVGYGECYAGVYVPEMVELVVAKFSELLCGTGALNPEESWKRAWIPFVSRNGLFCSVYSAIDIALWNIKSQVEGKRVSQLIASSTPRKEIPTYYSGGSAAFSRNQIKEDILAAKEQGFTAFKMRVGFQDWNEDLARVETARSILGEGQPLMVDAIMGTINPPWNLIEASSKVRELEPYGLTWIEEPLAPDRLSDFVKLRENSNVPIASGEGLTGWLDYESYIERGAVDVLQVDVTHCGGITAAVQIIRFAEKRGIPVAMHVWGSRLAYAANLECALACPAVAWMEQPSVSLEINKDIGTLVSDPKMLESYRFIPKTGFRWPNAR